MECTHYSSSCKYWTKHQCTDYKNIRDQQLKRLADIRKETKHAASNIIESAKYCKKHNKITIMLLFKIFESFDELLHKTYQKSIQYIAMNLHYDSLSYLDHTCRTSTHQHIRRYRSRFLDNTHRIRCSGYCISDHSIFQTNQIYTIHLNEVSNNLETREIKILQQTPYT